MSQFNKVQLGLVAEQLVEIDSTNAELVRRLSVNPPPPGGFLLTAQHQTSGRGQSGKQWHSTAGKNWMGSLLLHPVHLFADQAFRLSQVCALAVKETVEQFIPNYTSVKEDDSAGKPTVSIKWPNDILVDGRKIAGILIQTGIQGRQLSWAILGIGLNANQKAFPASLARPATSLALESRQLIDLKVLQSQLLSRLQYFYEQSAHPNFRTLDQAYQLHLFQRDELSHYRDLKSNKTFKGLLRGTDMQGRLLLDGPQGRLTTYDPQTIAFL
ncbi:MAG: biotin--[acetyl-CoA-carboxylase] ligase [Bacteroidota bacterium]